MDVELAYVLKLLSSESNKERTTGISELRRLTRFCNFKIVAEKDILRCFDQICHQLYADQALLKRSKNASKTVARDRLYQGSLALREFVAVSLPRFKAKTVRKVLDQLTRLLSTKDAMFEPIAINFLRSLHSVLSYASHLEHLDRTTWNELVHLCCDRIELHEEVSLQTSVDFDNVGSDSSNLAVSTSTMKTRATLLLSCLRLLTSWPAAEFHNHNSERQPLCDRIAALIITHLNRHHTESDTHLTIFAIAYCLLNYASQNDLLLARNLTCSVLASVPLLWSCRSIALKQQLLSTIMISVPFWNIALNFAEAVGRDIRALYSVIQAELIQKYDKYGLEITHLSFGLNNAYAPFGDSSRTFVLGNTSDLATHTFFVLQLAGHSFNVLIDQDFSATPYTQQSEKGNKKIRRQSFLDDALDQLGNHSSAVIVMLQILTFAYELKAPLKGVRQLYPIIRNLIQSEDVTIQSWSILWIASLVSRTHADQAADGNNQTCWRHIPPSDINDLWSLCIRKLSLPSICRVNCHLLSILLGCHPLNVINLLVHVDDVVRSIENIGPSVVADASCHFITSLFVTLASHNCFPADVLRDNARRWLQSRWLTSARSEPSSLYARELFCLLNFCGNQSEMWLEDSDRLKAGLLQVVATIKDNEAVTNFLLGKPCPALSTLAGIEQQFLPNYKNSELTELLAMVKHKLSSHSARLEILTFDQPDHGSQYILLENLHLLDTITALLLFNRKADTVPDNSCKDVLRFLTHMATVAENWILSKASNPYINQIIQNLDQSLLQYRRWLETKEEMPFVSTNFEGLRFQLSRICTVLSDKLCLGLTSSDADTGVLRIEDEDDPQVGMTAENLNALRKQGRDWITDCSSCHHVSRAVELKLAEQLFSTGKLTAQYSLDVMSSVSPSSLTTIASAALPLAIRFEDAERQAYFSGLICLVTRNVLSEYELERAESTHLFVVDLLLASIYYWVTDCSPKCIAEPAGKIFRWLIHVCIESNLGSVRTKKKLVNLFQLVIQTNPEHGQEADQSLAIPVVSTRSLLLGLLADDDISVCYTSALAAVTLFDLFGAFAHMAIFDDIKNNLDTRERHTERLAIRAFCLGQMLIKTEFCRIPAIYHLVCKTQ